MTSQDQPSGPDRSSRKLVWLMLTAATVAVMATIATLLFAQPGEARGLQPLARGAMAKLKVAEPPRPAPAATFTGPRGERTSLARFRGKVAVVNFWATWCAPCVKEMPTLARLQADYARQPLAVVPISLDSESANPKARAFIAKHRPLQYYAAPLSMAFSMKPPAPGLPTTLILDKQGRERARLSSDADWSSPAARAVIDQLLREG
ncbi:MAG TPA: TlpA disulfide reductase family protein [Caulobacteraceae bacterium]|jgi:thiol-disulfide isomerase/thioredoxin